MVLHIIVLLFEVLYYSMFMKFARKEGKFWRYLLLFSLITIAIYILNTEYLITYLILILLILYGIKFIVKIKISLYDMLVIFIMLLTKLIIETPFYVILSLFTKNNFLLTFPASIFKVTILYFLKNILGNNYIKFKKIWDNNNFYIRYIFTTFMFLFVIFSCIFLIIKLGGE